MKSPLPSSNTALLVMLRFPVGKAAVPRSDRVWPSEITALEVVAKVVGVPSWRLPAVAVVVPVRRVRPVP